MWDQGRLEEEGIQNVQNLAGADVVGLIVNTRISVMSIVNWVDQALLLAHAPEDFQIYREWDIPTASDFEAIYAGRLDDTERATLVNSNPARVTYMGCQGITSIPSPAGDMVKAFQDKTKKGTKVEFDIKERVHNTMIAICDDVSFQKLWRIKHGGLSEEPAKPPSPPQNVALIVTPQGTPANEIQHPAAPPPDDGVGGKKTGPKHRPLAPPVGE